jgi:tetratricopeptide (TPR) repeat protein
VSEVAHLDDLERRGPFAGAWHLYLRNHFDIGSFGIGAYVADEPGIDVIEEHDETGSLSGGHEELYLVLRGRATFFVDGDEVEAPPGTLVFVGDPGTRRKATAREPGTTVLAIGGVPGEAFKPAPWESIAPFSEPLSRGDYDGARQALERGLEQYPGNAGIHFNLACVESLAGRTDAAFEHLREAVARGDERMLRLARTDDDLAPLRDDPRFEEIVR